MSTFGEASEDQPITNIVKTQLEGKTFSAKKTIEWERRKSIPLLNDVTIGMLEGVVLENGGKEIDVEIFKNRVDKWVDEVNKAKRCSAWKWPLIKGVVGVFSSMIVSFGAAAWPFELAEWSQRGFMRGRASFLDDPTFFGLWLILTGVSSTLGIQYLINDIKEKRRNVKKAQQGQELIDYAMRQAKEYQERKKEKSS